VQQNFARALKLVGWLDKTLPQQQQQQPTQKKHAKN
jgi:hypothetical protein